MNASWTVNAPIPPLNHIACRMLSPKRQANLNNERSMLHSQSSGCVAVQGSQYACPPIEESGLLP